MVLLDLEPFLKDCLAGTAFASTLWPLLVPRMIPVSKNGEGVMDYVSMVFAVVTHYIMLQSREKGDICIELMLRYMS